MNLIVLGSGTTVPHPRRTSSAYWLETAGGVILLDCAASAMMRMLQEGLPWWEIDAIWISHFHMDHFGGLPPFLAGVKHSDEMKRRKKPMTIFGPQGFRRLMETINEANAYKLFEQPYALEIVEVEPLEEFEIVKGVKAVAMSTPHTKESLAIHVRDTDDSTFVFTSDTGFTDVLASFAANVDLLVIESSYFKDKTEQKHLELAEAMFIIRKARPKRAVLTHLYGSWDEVDLENEIGAFSPPCEVIEAVDGLRVLVNSGQ